MPSHPVTDSVLSALTVRYTSGLQSGVRVLPGVGDILDGTRKHLTSIKTKHMSSLNLEPALIFALTKIPSRIDVLACQKQAQSFH
jgi:hypothetical protein